MSGKRILIIFTWLIGGIVSWNSSVADHPTTTPASPSAPAASPLPGTPTPSPKPAETPTANAAASGPSIRIKTEVLTPEQIAQDGQRRAELFRPFQTERATLSPDGKYLAYTYREGEDLSVVVIDLANPSVAKSKVTVTSDTSATQMLANTREHAVASIRWMKWVTPNRLAVETNRNFALSTGAAIERLYDATEPTDDTSTTMPNLDTDLSTDLMNVSGSIVAFDADGKNAKTLVTPQDVAEDTFDNTAPVQRPPTFRADQPASTGLSLGSLGGGSSSSSSRPATAKHNPRSPRIFDLCNDDPESIFVQAQGTRGYDLYRLNVVTGKLRQVEEEVVNPDDFPIFDRRGKARVVVPATQRTAFPHKFKYDREKGFSRWTDLDTLSGTQQQPMFLVSPENFFGQRAIPLGFDENPDLLYFASNVGRDTFGIYALNVKTGQRGEQAIEHPLVDLITPDPLGNARPGALVYDRYDRQFIGVRYAEAVDTTLWFRRDWSALQQRLEKSFPGRTVDILEWDKAAQHFLILVRGVTDPGGYYILDTTKGTIGEYARRAPWLKPEAISKTMAFSFEEKPGLRISGLITVPTSVHMSPIPMIVLCPDDPWRRVSSEYRPDVQALANMGLAVVQINLRGAWGFGVKYRDAVKSGYEQAQVEDILATIDYLAKHVPVHAKRVALLGRARGAFLALRAIQMYPDRFRCAVALEPTVDLGSWLGDARWTTSDPGPALTRALLGSSEDLKKASVLAHTEPVGKPVQFLVYPGPPGGDRTQAYLDVRRLQERIQKSNTPADRVDLDDDYVSGLPGARSQAYGKIEEFLNLYVYAYDVKLGETKEVKE